jgi:glutaredoxin-like YruB-family protein
MDIKVYTTPSCPWCMRAKEFLGERQVRFTEVDVVSDRAGAMEMMRKSGQRNVPVIDINGKIVIGFEKDRIEELIHQPNT